MPDATVRRGRVPVEMGSIVGGVAAVGFTLIAGIGLSAVLPDRSPLALAAAYLGPASLAFVAYWWIAQRS